MIRQIFPSKIMIQTTSFCNSDCIMCPYGETSKILTQGKMEWKLFKKIILECKKNDVERILLYLMNEPLMDKEIVKKINYAKRKNPKAIVHIVSNGNLLNEKLSKKIIKSKLDYIEFSVHGINKASYEETMKKLKFNKTIQNIEKFISMAQKYKKKKDYVHIKTLNIKNKTKNKQKIIEFWKEKGINNINYFEAPISRAGNIGWLKVKTKEEVKGCNSIWRDEMIHILFNGNIILCCMDWKRENILGNIRNKSIKDIWNDKKYMKTEQIILGKLKSPKNFICKKCEESS